MLSPRIPPPTCHQPSAHCNLACATASQTRLHPNLTPPSSQWMLLHFKDRQQRLREMCQLPHHHTAGEGQSATEHSRSDSQVHTRSLDQPCLLCSGTVAGHSKHICAETLEASRCSSPWNVLPSPQPSPSSPPPWPNFYASFKNQHKCQLLHKNPFFSSQLFAPNCLPTHNAFVIDLLPPLFPWGRGLGFIDH